MPHRFESRPSPFSNAPRRTLDRRLVVALSCGLALGVTALAARPAHATGCESAASVTSDIWAEWGTEIKIVGCIGVAAASGGMTFDSCYASANKLDKLIQNMIAFWNKQANNSWAKIGPRRLDFDMWHEGNIIGTTGRMFISAYPAHKKHVRLKITKLDGKGKVGVAVCKQSSDKKWTKVTEHEFNPGDDNVGHTWEILIKGAKDDVISVHIDGKSVTNSFKYKLRANLLDDENEVETEDDVDRTVPREDTSNEPPNAGDAKTKSQAPAPAPAPKP
jgi:hypothetical protein